MAIKSPSDKAKKSPVKIRFKSLADGCKSIYLDIYVKGKRRYEFLKLYIHPGNVEKPREHDPMEQKEIAP